MSAGRPAGDGSRGPLRVPVVLGVAALIAAGALIGRLPAANAPRTDLQPAAVAFESSPVSAQSSSWYCTGGTGPANPLAPATLLVVNSGSRTVHGSVRVVDDRGKAATAPLVVPERGEVSENPGKVVSGGWLSSKVGVLGGGVSVDEVVTGSSGWSVAPCATQTSATWYFATGSTALGNSMYVSLFNPTDTLAVVDLSFVTSSGLQQPEAFQGIVLPPGATTTETVGTYVQDQPAVATEVTARSGTVVATELQQWGANGLSGMSLRLGAPSVSTVWDLPGMNDPQDGASQLVVFNPSDQSESVRVAVELPSGSVAPFTQRVGPTSTWDLATSQQLRIPVATDYSVRVTAAGGAGVVVERTDAEPATAPAPQWAAEEALPAAVASVARRWVVPSPSALGVSGIGGTLALAIQNPGPQAVNVTIGSLTRSGFQTLPGHGHLVVAAHSFAVLPVGSSGATSAPGGAASSASTPGTTGAPNFLSSVEVNSDAPVAVEADASPQNEPGLISFPAIPLG